MPAPVDELQIHAVAGPEYGYRRITVFSKAWYGSVADRGQRISQAARFDHMSRRNRNVFLTQQTCGPREPLRTWRAALLPQQLVPDRRINARAISRAVRESFVRP